MGTPKPPDLGRGVGELASRGIGRVQMQLDDDMRAHGSCIVAECDDPGWGELIASGLEEAGVRS